MNTTNKEIKEKEERLLSFKQEVEGLRNISDAEEYAKQLAHLFLGNGLSLKIILLMAIDFGQQHPNWISVEDYEKDELPSLKDKEDKYGCSVGALFVVNLDGVQYINKGCFDYDTGVWHSLDTCMSYTKEQVTHWMPLPQPPRSENRREQIRTAAEEKTRGVGGNWEHIRKGAELWFIRGALWADQHPKCISVEKTNNTINVFFRKEQDGWHTYTQYGIDLPTSTAIEFGEHIAKAVNLLNGKGVTNE